MASKNEYQLLYEVLKKMDEDFDYRPTRLEQRAVSLVLEDAKRESRKKETSNNFEMH